MNSKNSKKLNELIETRLNNLDESDQTLDAVKEGSGEKKVEIGQLKELSSIVLASEKEAHEHNINKARVKLEKEKFAFEKSIKEQEINLRTKEYNVRALELEATKKKYKFELIMKLGATLAYLLLSLNAQRHDYKDFKLESSYSKEGRNNLLK